MLHHVRITDFAIVDSLDVPFRSGLTVFTGETGAGKSVLVEALRFLLGGRASAEMIRTGTECAVVEGQFDWPKGLKLGDDVVDAVDSERVWLRRELPLKGAGRCFLDDRQITRATLAQIAEYLGDLCGQHQQQILLDPGRHTEFLDAIGGHGPLVVKVQEAFARLADNRAHQAELRKASERRREQRELTDFQIQEIRAAGITPGEDDRLRSEANVLKNARRLTEAAEHALSQLSEDDNAMASRVATLLRDSRKMADIDDRWQTISEKLALAQETFEELSRYITDYRQQLEFDPGRLDQIEARLAELFRLKQKYGDSCAAILERLEQLESERLADGREDERIAELQTEEAELSRCLARDAIDLSEKRRRIMPKLEKNANELLAVLGMKNARLKVEWTPVFDGGLVVQAANEPLRVRDFGTESVRFTFEANPAEGFKPLDKIASGGELSRVLLVFKSLELSARAGRAGNGQGAAQLYVFDEIDSGIGGATAYAVAKQIKGLAKHAQVFLITHLQQMAAPADHHFQIAKETVDKRARVRIHSLDHDARVRELARMVAGDNITDRSLEFAAELTTRSE
jgi:DNA repair protein RecN (Recombination protein N)